MNGLIRYAILFVICCVANFANSQTHFNATSNRYSFQYGLSLKCSVEFGHTQYRPNPIFRITVNGGVGSNFISEWLYPSLNIEVQLYNGGLGSRNEKTLGRTTNDLDIITALTLTAGSNDRFKTNKIKSLEKRNVPLYYFSDFVHPALQNPYDASFSLGTNVIFTPLNREKKDQRIGFINGHFKQIQLSYYNDGGIPIYDTYLGDRKDRYYTGGGVISYHGKTSTSAFADLLEISYKKFTGYTKNAFEISNKLLLNFMNYHTTEQRLYNKSLWTLNIANTFKGVGLTVASYNKVAWDMQHYIHWGLFNTYHMVPYKSYWAISASYYYVNTNIGIK